MQQSPTSAFQELERGAKYVEYRTRSLRQTVSNVIFTPKPQSETDRFMHDYENKQLFNSVVIAEDVDDWEELTDAALKVATVSHLNFFIKDLTDISARTVTNPNSSQRLTRVRFSKQPAS